MATLIPFDAVPRKVTPASGPSFTLSELQGFVGGYIEALYLDGRYVMFINEDGKRLELPHNPIATGYAAHKLRPEDYIVGAAIVCTHLEAGG